MTAARTTPAPLAVSHVDARTRLEEHVKEYGEKYYAACRTHGPARPRENLLACHVASSEYISALEGLVSLLSRTR